MESGITNEALAHVAEDGKPHLLSDHLRGVADLAASFAEKLGAVEHARLAGLWHDLGKYSGDFQKMIREENGFEAHIEAEGGPRDHSTAGAVLALDRGGPYAAPIMFAIAGHHAGLPDQVDLRTRLSEKQTLLRNVLLRSPDPSLLEAAVPALPSWAAPTNRHRLEFWTRMLFSALCDADFLDTEAFYDGERSTLRRGRPALAVLATQLRASLDTMEAQSPSTNVNLVRRDVRKACIAAAACEPGVFSLTVPTGGGKTLASMAFALEHALRHGLERVVVVIPFTSIIEQSAKVYRDIFGASALIEHHSALDPATETPANRVACENWDAPVVVTTTVQFFESLLANRPAACRKLHRLARSVVVLDEAQALPGKLLPTILDVLRDLVANYRTSIVISTATQPAFGKSSILTNGFESMTEICPSSLELFDRLQRVSVRWPDGEAPMTYQTLAREVAAVPSCLAVVHLRTDARVLCGLIDGVAGDQSTFHLSALMTPEHRTAILASIKTAQRAGRPVRAVSTQLVEAGVDLDFPIVFRAFGGLDSLAQAAGRCNREGTLHSGELRVFMAETHPPMGIPRTARDIALRMLRAQPSLDIFDPILQRHYFSELYERTDLSKGNALQDHRQELRFKTVATAFRLIEDGWSAPLVIAHGNGATHVAALRHLGPSRERLRALQRFTINVHKLALKSWIAGGFVTTVHDTVAVLEGVYLKAYDSRFGLVPERIGTADPSMLFVG